MLWRYNSMAMWVQPYPPWEDGAVIVEWVLLDIVANMSEEKGQGISQPH